MEFFFFFFKLCPWKKKPNCCYGNIAAHLDEGDFILKDNPLVIIPPFILYSFVYVMFNGMADRF